MKITKQQLYKRQTTLSEIGEKGQEKLLKTKVIIVGCGGLGSIAAVYLAASGIGNIHLIDFDMVDASNLHRQVFYKIEDVGKLKSKVLATHIETISPFVKVSFSTKAIAKRNVLKTIQKSDFVVDCTDSLPTKYLLNDACILQDKTLIYGSLYKFDGYISSFNAKNAKGAYGTNLRDAFPKISEEAIPNCSEIGTLNTIVGIIGLMQANEVLKLVTGIGQPLINQLLIYNSLENTQYKMKLKSSFTKEKIMELFKKETYYDAACEIQKEEWLISPKELRQKLAFGEATRDLHLISVIEDTEVKLPFAVRKKIPLSSLKVKQFKFITTDEYVIVCQQGISSYTATQQIKAVYPNLKIFSLKGGTSSY
ncbi:MAG: HesA/MoeB/ThiF family protein [Flavobacteriaceae bacterium]|nr:HesA/MoeB/ThiF family protein [Flavobacteriaceae bacterium]